MTEPLTNSESSADAVDLIIDKLFPAGEPDSQLYRERARKLFAGRECYIRSFFNAIEEDYVSIDNYLQKALELHVDNLVRLKTLYLEDEEE